MIAYRSRLASFQRDPRGLFGQALNGIDGFLAAPILLADKAYDADERIPPPLQAMGKTAVIPCKDNRLVRSRFSNLV